MPSWLPSLRHQLVIFGLVFSGLLRLEAADAWPDPGLPSTHDLFPLNMISMSYRPLGAEVIEKGRWQFSFQVTRSNTFEFSDLIKDRLEQNEDGRIRVDRQKLQEFARTVPDEPLLFYFDGETQSTELQARYGLTERTDFSLTLNWLSQGGGFMDTWIEGFHRMGGFQQTGRDDIARNRLAMAVIRNGQVTYYDDGSFGWHASDPVVQIRHELFRNKAWILSVRGDLRIPLTHFKGVFQSGWDTNLGLMAQWQPTEHQALHAGLSYLKRSLDNVEVFPFKVHNQVDGHVGWEWKGEGRFRPFLLLNYTSALTYASTGSRFDRSSLNHDLGSHYRLTKNSALTFSYINGISHNKNTSDCEFALRLAVRK